MSDPKEHKSGNNESKESDGEAARAARERELRELIQRVQKEHSGSSPPKKESPHDFVERKRREQKKGKATS